MHINRPYTVKQTNSKPILKALLWSVFLTRRHRIEHGLNLRRRKPASEDRRCHGDLDFNFWFTLSPSREPPAQDFDGLMRRNRSEHGSGQR